jgi:hypothetical protein
MRRASSKRSGTTGRSGQWQFTTSIAELYRSSAGVIDPIRRLWRTGAPFRILEVRYEDVVADLEGEAQRLVAHCGLKWDQGCLAFPETERPVRTASATQVRQPIYERSIGRWHAHEAFLGPLLAGLAIAEKAT